MAELKENKRQDGLREWLQKARLSDVTYHRTRQQLWGKLITVWDFRLYDKILFKSLKSALCCRSQDMDDNKKLAFETALDELEEMLAEDDADDEGDEARVVPAAPKRE